MKPTERALQIQSWVDGELSSRQARAVAAGVEADPEARALARELRATRRILVDHELEHRVPETREFYWSGISRGLEAQAKHRRPSWFRLPFWGRGWLVPGGAVAACLVALVAWKGGLPWMDRGSRYLATGHEIETPIEEAASITFRSESARMTVVWVDFQIN